VEDWLQGWIISTLKRCQYLQPATFRTPREVSSILNPALGSKKQAPRDRLYWVDQSEGLASSLEKRGRNLAAVSQPIQTCPACSGFFFDLKIFLMDAFIGCMSTLAGPWKADSDNPQLRYGSKKFQREPIL
jgi:hypothetical protein